MSLFARRRYPESSYECWRDVFEPYLVGLYETMVRRLTAGGALRPHHRVSFVAFCSFVYQFSSKEVPDIFFRELEETLGN